MLYLIKVVMPHDAVDPEKQDEYFAAHVSWFSKYFEKGTFLMLGPITDLEHAGFILAQAESREAIDKILAEDMYYSVEGITYEVNEFQAALMSDKILDYKE